jgi:hypothetical protein
VIVEITCNNTRTLDPKKAVFAAVADNLTAAPACSARTW